MALDKDGIIRVNLVQSDSGKDRVVSKRNLENICNKFDVHVYIYFGENSSTCVLFPDVKFCARVTKCKNFTRVRNNTLYYRRGSKDFSFIHSCSPNLLKHLVPRNQHGSHRDGVTCMTYDLSTDTFVSKNVRVSKHVKPHQVESLAEGRSCFKTRPEEAIVLSTLPYERDTFHLPVQTTDGADWSRFHLPVQATDGPHENVEYDSPFTAMPQNPMMDTAVQTPPIPTPPCRHPDFADERRRVLSFGGGWPHAAEVQDINKLAKYGLYYTGPGDLVRCYQCGLGMKDWSPIDDPLLEHVKFFPECPHLLREVEPSMLQAYKIRASTRNTTGRYRHPEYSTEQARWATFDRWPRDLSQTPDVLVNAGLYYTGFEDRVRCYCCDGGLQHWDREDDPWVEHARWFPHCEHVKRVKGEDYIRMVQLSLQYSDNEEEESSDVTSSMSALRANGARGGARESDDVIYSPAAQSVITTCGFSVAAVRKAIQECTDKGIRWNSEILANLLFEKQERGEVLPTDTQRPETPVQAPVDDSTEEGLQQERRRLLSRLLCVQCEERDANILFLPCAHRKMCLSCSQAVAICPVCGKPVREKVHTYMG